MTSTSALRLWARLGGTATLLASAVTLQAQTVACLPDAATAYGYTKPKLAQREAVTVFIHGLHGDAKGTWTAKGLFGSAIAAWPCLVQADQEVFAGTNAYLASYRTELGGTNPRIDEAARQIAADLVTDDVFAHGQVTFVAHSMGGIVLARMLSWPGLLSAEHRRRVRLVVFVGTPALPTEAATLCAKFGVNAQCQEMSDAAAMARLWKAWDDLKPAPASWCVAEGADMWFLGVPPWLRIVPAASAHRPCLVASLRTVAEGLDHAAVAKPEGLTQRPHRDLRNAYSACVRPHLNLAPRAGQEARNQLAEGASRWFYALKDRLLAQPELTVDTVRAHLASENDVNRYWHPGTGGAASFDADSYERLNAPSFAQALRESMPEMLPPAEFHWARRVSQVSDVVADSAFDVMARRMRDSGGLRPDDVVLALRPRVEVDGLALLLLRQGSSNSPADAAAAAWGVLGLAVIPKPVDRCGAGLAE